MPVDYQIVRSKRKTTCLKIEDGKLVCYTNYLTPKFELDAFVKKHESWYLNKMANPVQKVGFNIETDNHIWFLGKKYKLTVKTGMESTFVINGDEIIFTGKSINTIKNDIKGYFKNYLIKYAQQASDNTGEEFELQFRYYTSRWGCCYKAKRLIVLNYYLLCLPENCIRQVVHHEIAHLRVPNHQKAFYDRLGQIYPQYRKDVKELRKFTI